MGEILSVKPLFNPATDNHPKNIMWVDVWDEDNEDYVTKGSKRLEQKDLATILNGNSYHVCLNLESNNTDTPVLNFIVDGTPETTPWVLNRVSAGYYILQKAGVEFSPAKCSLPWFGANGAPVISISDVNVTEVSYYFQAYTQTGSTDIYIEIYRAADNTKVDINEALGATGSINLNFYTKI